MGGGSRKYPPCFSRSSKLDAEPTATICLNPPIWSAVGNANDDPKTEGCQTQKGTTLTLIYYHVLYWGLIGVILGYIEIMENKLETTN